MSLPGSDQRTPPRVLQVVAFDLPATVIQHALHHRPLFDDNSCNDRFTVGRQRRAHRGQQGNDHRRDDVGEHDTYRRNQRQQNTGVAFDHLDTISDVVRDGILLRIANRIVVNFDRSDATRAEPDGGDREDRAAGSEVGHEIAASNEALHQAKHAASRLMLAGPKRHRRVDDDRLRWILEVGQPRGRNHQLADSLNTYRRTPRRVIDVQRPTDADVSVRISVFDGALDCVDWCVGSEMRYDAGAVFLNSHRAGIKKRRDHSVAVRLWSDSQRDPAQIRRLVIRGSWTKVLWDADWVQSAARSAVE